MAEDAETFRDLRIVSLLRNCSPCSVAKQRRLGRPVLISALLVSKDGRPCELVLLLLGQDSSRARSSESDLSRVFVHRSSMKNHAMYFESHLSDLDASLAVC